MSAYGGDDIYGFVPSESILMFKASVLARSRAAQATNKKKDEDGLRASVDEFGLAKIAAPAPTDEESGAPLVELYVKHSGDLDLIFKDLGDHPGKAKKYPPADAEEFARKVWHHDAFR